jgi:hypothetical protein
MRLLKLAGAVLLGLLGVWFEAVRSTAEVKARKRRRRARLR